jgi:putative oxidoreductase
MKLGLAVLRMIVGGLFMGHGLQKLAGWFGGPGLEKAGKGFESMGLRPGKAHAATAGAAETTGGALLAVGLLTPLAGALLSGTMITAIRKVHGAKGPWNSEGGYEFNLTLLGAVFLLAELGPGDLSLEGVTGRRRHGTLWALAQLAAGAAGSYAATTLAERLPASAQAQPGAAADSRPDAEQAPAEATAA